MNGGLCEGYPTEDILGKWARRVADRQTLWTKCLLFWMHVLDMVGLASHSLSAKAFLFECPGPAQGPDRRPVRRPCSFEEPREPRGVSNM